MVRAKLVELIISGNCAVFSTVLCACSVHLIIAFRQLMREGAERERTTLRLTHFNLFQSIESNWNHTHEMCQVSAVSPFICGFCDQLAVDLPLTRNAEVSTDSVSQATDI